MTWSHWFVTPAVTSLFFLLGVLTLYWFLTNGIIRFLKNHGKHPNPDQVRTHVGVIYITLLIVGMQLAVNGTSNSWVFANFQIFAIVFVSYFLLLDIHFWQLVSVILIFMAVNGTMFVGLSWIFGTFYIGLFYAMKLVKKHRHHHWLDFVDYTIASLTFSAVLWGLIGIRFELPHTTLIWELIFSFFLLTIMYIYLGTLISSASTLAQLTYTTNFDELTKVKNYFAFKNDFERGFGQSKLANQPLTLMLFDIDHFKNVNDTYGHLAGDYVLNRTANLITTQLQTIDPELSLYRTGGEEFTILFTNYSMQQARTHIDAIAQSIRETKFEQAGNQITVRLSVGVTQVRRADVEQLDVYKRADQNLYYSKRHGRDQVTVG